MNNSSSQQPTQIHRVDERTRAGNSPVYPAGFPKRAGTPSPKKRKKIGWGCIAILLGLLVLVNVSLVFVFAYDSIFHPQVKRTFSPEELTPEVLAGSTPVYGTLIPNLLPVATENLQVPKGVHYLLLLGIDARPEEGTITRTDTIMVVRLDFENKTARLLGFPRDLWVSMPEYLWPYAGTEARINQAHFYGEYAETPGGGAQAAMDTVRLNFGLPIEGYMRVNFQAFVQGVDALGGVDIDVPVEINDWEFPTDDYGVMYFHVDQGYQHMDGITALRYARTRHQDSDHERIKRQQLVMLAIRDAALQFDIVTKVPGLWSAFSENVSTTLSLPELMEYGLAGQAIPRENIRTYTLTPDVLQGVMTEGGAAVFLPVPELVSPILAEFTYDGISIPPTPELTPYFPTP